ncbi:MAG: hypothetical protein AAFU81_12530, partial [Pseudomonadota bacterium]
MTKLSRFWGAAVIIMVILLSACANTPSQTRTIILPALPAAPTVQVENIHTALTRFMSAEGDQLILLPNRL